MASSLTCPEQAKLLALAMGDPSAAELTAHLAGCAICQSSAPNGSNHTETPPWGVCLIPGSLAPVDHDELPHPIVAYLPRTILDRFGREKHRA